MKNKREVFIPAYAKLNLSLYITGVRGDGMHELDSVFVSVELSDGIRLRYTGGGPSVIFLSGAEHDFSKGLDPLDNTALKAMRLLSAELPFSGYCAEIEKNIPVGAGLGGSSADAAGVILGAAELLSIEPGDPRLIRIAAACGSDVPGMLYSGFKRVTGAGENTVPIASGASLGQGGGIYAVIAMGQGGVSTREAYRAFDELNPSAGLREAARRGKEKNDALQAMIEKGSAAIFTAPEYIENGLSAAAERLQPEICAVRNALNRVAPYAPSGITGSGAAVFALLKSRDEAERVRDRLSGKLPFVCAARLLC